MNAQRLFLFCARSGSALATKAVSSVGVRQTHLESLGRLGPHGVYQADFKAAGQVVVMAERLDMDRPN